MYHFPHSNFGALSELTRRGLLCLIQMIKAHEPIGYAITVEQQQGARYRRIRIIMECTIGVRQIDGVHW